VRTFQSRPDFIQRKQWITQEEPVTVAEVKAQLRFVFDMEDALISGYIASARDRCEAELNRKIRRQRLELTYSAWGTGLRLDRMGHEVEIESITYVDATGATQTMPSADYRIKKDHLLLVLPAIGTDWPALNCEEPTIVVTLQAGYADAADVPQPVKNWIMAVAASMFRSRESHSDKSMTELEFIGGLLDDYRIKIV